MTDDTTLGHGNVTESENKVRAHNTAGGAFSNDDSVILLSLFEAASDAILIVDTDGQIIRANSQAASLFGYTRDELLGRPVEMLVPPRLAEAHAQRRADYIAHPHTRPMGLGLDLRGVRSDGTEFPVDIGLGHYQAGDTAFTLCILRDLTVRRQAEQQAAHERELRALDEMSGATQTAVTAQTFGLAHLRAGMPELFQALVRRYGDLLGRAVEARAHKSDHDVSEGLREIARQLGFVKATPRDVLDIHTATLKEKTEGASPQTVHAYSEEARFMVLELMGNLVSYFRSYYVSGNVRSR